MTFEAFEQAARAAYERIPEQYREGVDGLVVSEEAPTHPALPDVHTLGECLTEAYPSDFGGPDTVRSTVVLYWGSFRKLSGRDPEFDWDEELWETLTHELRHHLESLADEDDLEGVDYAMHQSFLREDGKDWDPFFYQHGDAIGRGAIAVEDHVFIEVEFEERDLAEWNEVPFRWNGRAYSVPLPEESADVHFVLVDGGIPNPPRVLEVVLVRKRGWLDTVRSLFGGGAVQVHEWVAEATPVDGDGDSATGTSGS